MVLDDLSSHKTAMVRQTLEDNGIRASYLVPYSPDLNPIENAFSKTQGIGQVGGAADHRRPMECCQTIH
ncbi:MAG: transposase [Planctomycetota bacterium]